MNINSVNGSNGAGSSPVSMNQTMDSYSKNLQNQIAQLQKQQQELAKNNEMDPQAKMKKRQELQQQISDLNMQLRQHQVEERRRAQQEKAQSSKTDQAKAQEAKAQENGTGMSQAGMTAMISAQNSLEQARVQGNTATQMQDRADVLKSEIKLDGSRGGDTSRKKAEVAELEAKAQTATTSQLSTLAEANQTMSEAAEADRANSSENTAKKTETEDDKAVDGKPVEEAGDEDTGTEAVSLSQNEKKSGNSTQPGIGNNVDVKI